MKKISIVEVGPRDGFQSLKCATVPTEEKLKIIDGIVSSGIRHIEFTSFVSPKAIPQLADSAEVTRAVVEKYTSLDMFALVPNLRGAKNAYELGLRKVCYVVSLSSSHNMANIKRTHEQSMTAYEEIREMCPGLQVDLDLATTFGCPFEGKNGDVERIIEFLRGYVDNGINGCCLCDTVGVADPAQVKRFIEAITEAYPGLRLSVHFHDTRGLGMVNTLTAINAGINEIQTSLGGLGGCPFAPGASGNLATEDTVWMLDEMGFETGVNFVKLLETAKYQKKTIPGNYSGHHINIEQPV